MQPPSGGCVLKQAVKVERAVQAVQPPSGSCVLKPYGNGSDFCQISAAFGRLCVETGVDIILITQMPGSRLRAAVC